MMKYNPHSWRDHLFDIKGSLVLDILGRVSLCVLWSTLVVIWAAFVPDPYDQINLPETAHALIGGVISLLLVFRTNTAYDRFWEGRRMWGGIVNETRNLVRQASSYAITDRPFVDQITLWTITFCYATMHRLRTDRELGPLVLELPAAQVQDVLRHEHLPLAISQKMTMLVREAEARGSLTSQQAWLIDQNIQLLIDYLGACERIHSTPLPYAYCVHLRRSLIAYCFTLPLALVGRFGWETIPATLLISYILLGIEEIGVEIEDPFGNGENDLPLEDFCQNIRVQLQSCLDNTPSPAPTITSRVP